MFLINTAMEKISIGTAALIVVLGMAVVFFGLILLMYVTKIAGAIISRKKAPPAGSPCTTFPTRRLLCSWPSSQTGPASPSISFASSPSAKSRIDRCFQHVT